MSSSDTGALYAVLLKRYREKGFLNPDIALDASIRDVMYIGHKTRAEAIRELYSSDSPWTHSPPKPFASSSDSQQEKATAEDIAVAGQIADLKEKIDSLTTLFSKGQISEETYIRGVKRIEEDISRLQREHGISIVEKREHTPTSISRYATQVTREYAEASEPYHYESPTGAWYLVPFLFGILGGIVAYVAVKDDDANMAENLLVFGILWTLALAFFGWILFLH